MEEPQDAVGRRSVGPGLLEREAELAAISNAVAAAAEGRGSLLAIEGQAGIGKSRLLAAARALAADRGLDVAAARGSELERSLPFGAVRQLFEARVVRARNTPEDPVRGAAELAAPVFDPAAFDAAPDGGSLLSRLHGLYWLLVNLAEDRPLLVVVDDVHWIDDASLRLLRYLAPRVADLPVAIAVATRPPDDPTGAAAVAPLLTDPDVAVLRPSPLSADAVAALVETAVAAAADPRFVEACLEATAGNPFLLRELLAEVAERGLDASRVAADEVRRLGPGAIAASLLGRLGRVSPAATQLVRSLVILGDGTAVHVAGAFAGLDGDDALHAAHLLEATGLVEADDGLRFVHPIVRQAVYQDLTAVERGRRHAAAAAFLRGAGAAPEAVAAHLLHAPPAGEAATVAALRRAARRAAALGDTGVAAGYLLRALREPPPQEDLAAVLGELGRAEAEAGVPEAVEHLEACLALEPPAEIDLPAAEALANVLVFAGRPDRGAAVLEEALRRSSSGDGAEQRMRALLATVGCVGMPVRRRLLPMLHRFRDPGGPARDADDVRALAMLAATAAFDDNDGDRAADLGLRALAAPIEEPSDAATASARVALAVS
ncbi:MAG TPA: AAA family ATPase, partial [Capillimicrobium sp.]|nr:AAA family ATPase [Capillimicrobium sp.]